MFCFVYGFYFFSLRGHFASHLFFLPHSLLTIAFVLNFDNHVFEIHWFYLCTVRDLNNLRCGSCNQVKRAFGELL